MNDTQSNKVRLSLIAAFQLGCLWGVACDPTDEKERKRYSIKVVDELMRALDTKGPQNG